MAKLLADNGGVAGPWQLAGSGRPAVVVRVAERERKKMRKRKWKEKKPNNNNNNNNNNNVVKKMKEK